MGRGLYIVLVILSCLHVAVANKLRITFVSLSTNSTLISLFPLPASGLKSVVLKLFEFQNHTWVQSQRMDCVQDIKLIGCL